MAELFGTACVGQSGSLCGKHKHIALASQQLAPTGLLPQLTEFLSQKDVMVCKIQAVTMWIEKFNGIWEYLLPTKAKLIISLNLLIIHQSLGKNRV